MTRDPAPTMLARATLTDALEVLRALQDPTRLQLLGAVVGRAALPHSCSLAEAALRTGLPVRTVLETAGRMRDSGLLRLDGTTLTADPTVVDRAAEAVAAALPIAPALAATPGLARWFRRGRLVRVPDRWADQAELAAALVTLLPGGRDLAEGEVNRLLVDVGDPATLRRLLVDHRLVTRDAALVYRRADPVRPG
ncbi:DUF2087 domain-containing protein [Auraticoccus monumenti]|uniref:DUF2087 domain-containing protein n=1 Tax=Auraticoccus monumenti TaxID=675864 RepID=A0A1G7DQL1_9ACTN|nr:DUF2087 domain-containing protein [Auraticoccus monumenti]SDE53440.1 hypothetical protein SAMN04489747_3669 [Auraticoccus monumenti]